MNIWRIRHVHSSSRFTRSPRSLYNAVKTYTVGANLITLTEIGESKRARVLRTLLGWKLAQPVKGETGVLLRVSVWKLDAVRSVLLADVPGASRVFRATEAVLFHRWARRGVNVTVVHMPAHVQEGCGWEENEPNVEAYHECMRQLAARTRRAIYDSDRVVLCTGDLNLDLHQKCWRDYFARRLPTLRLSWNNHMPKAGSHGHRLIDGSLCTLDPSRIRLLRQNASSDHRPFREVFPLPRRHA